MSTLYFTEEELEEFLHYYHQESKIFLPNSIFDELKENIDITKPKRGSEHIAFAYSYIYLISYLYRYAKYINHLYTEKDLRKILQTSETVKAYKSYITKKGGVLDQLNYIKKEKEFPLRYYYEFDEPNFIMNHEYLEESGQEFEAYIHTTLPKNQKINLPFRAFPNKVCGGYFHDISNTHMIRIEIFIFCMSRKDLGTLGFYLYAFLKKMTDQNPNGWKCSRNNLVTFTGLKQTSLYITLKTLESYNMIYNSHEPYFINLDESDEKVERVPNTYKAIDYKYFVTEKQEVYSREIINLDENFVFNEPEQIKEINENDINSLF